MSDEHKKNAICQPLLETTAAGGEEEEEEEAAGIGTKSSPLQHAVEERHDEAHNVSGGRRLANVIVVTIGMSLLFMAYNTLQAYVSSLLPGNLGFQSLVVVYVAYELCLVISPFACEVLGDIGAMVLGSSCYVVYIGSLVTMNAAFILAASGLLGFGAAILWVGQGSALTRWSTDETRGKYAGIFWGGFQVSAVVGPLTSFMVLSDAPDDDKVTDLFVVFAAVSVLAVGVFSMHWCSCIKITFAADTAKKLQRKNSIASGDTQPSFWSRLCAPVARGMELCRTRDVALLLLACMFTGVETSFSNGEFFKLVGLLPCDAFSGNRSSCLNQSAGCLWNETAAAATCAKDVNIISLVFIAFGVGDVLGGYLLGALSDCCAKSPSAGVCRKLIVTFGTICYGVALGLTYWMKAEAKDGVTEYPQFPSWTPPAQATSWLSYVVAALYGLTDAAFQTQIYATLGLLHPTEGRVSFMLFQIFQQLGGIFGFALPLALDLSVSNSPIIIQAALLFASWITYCFVRIPSAEDST